MALNSLYEERGQNFFLARYALFLLNSATSLAMAPRGYAPIPSTKIISRTKAQKRKIFLAVLAITGFKLSQNSYHLA